MNYFYNVASIVIGALLLIFTIINLANKKEVMFNIIVLIFGLLFIATGVISLILIPSSFQWISILLLVLYAAILIILFIATNKNKKVKGDKVIGPKN